MNKWEMIKPRFNHTTIWIRLPPSFTIILPIGSVKVSITDLHRNLSCLNPDHCQGSGRVLVK